MDSDEDEQIDCKNFLNLEIQTLEDPTTKEEFKNTWKKCANVFTSKNNETFILVCIFCNTLYSEYENFITHIQQQHENICIIDEISTNCPNNSSEDKVIFSETNFENIFIEEQDYKPLPEQLDNEARNSSKGNREQNIPKLEKNVPKQCLEKRNSLKPNLRKVKESKLPIICEICHKVFESILELENHQNNDHTLKELTYLEKKNNSLETGKKNENDNCTKVKCSRLLKTEKLEKLHERSHSRNISIKCKKYDKEYTKIEHLISHVDFDLHPYKCVECKTTFTRKDYLDRHMSRHKEKQQIKCRYCEECFVSYARRQIHEKIHSEKIRSGINSNDDKEKEFLKCNIFNEQFITEKSLQTRSQSHTAISNDTTTSLEQDINNEFLAETTSSKEDDDSENDQNNEKSIKLFKCTFCSKSFKKKSSKESHELIHISDKKFKCEICQKEFARNIYLKRHSICHIEFDDHPYKCIQCKRTFTCKTYLDDHMREHNNEKIKCNYCEKSFTSNKKRRIHEKSHLPRTILCSFCGMSFIQNSHLKRHVNSVHLKLKPHKCKYCEKSFAVLREVEDHQRKHTGEKPFSCVICSKCFATREALSMHKNLHSDKDKYKCNICGKGFKQNAGLYMHKKTH